MMAERLSRIASPIVPGISDAVRVNAGDLLFVSGQTALRADGTVPTDFAEELDRCFAALTDALARAGSSPQDVARITIYVTELPSRSLATIREVRDRWFAEPHAPASALIGVAALALDNVGVEIDAIAATHSAG